LRSPCYCSYFRCVLSVFMYLEHLDLFSLSLHDALPISPNVRTSDEQLRQIYDKAVSGIDDIIRRLNGPLPVPVPVCVTLSVVRLDRKGTRLHSRHVKSSYALFFSIKNTAGISWISPALF